MTNTSKEKVTAPKTETTYTPQKEEGSGNKKERDECENIWEETWNVKVTVGKAKELKEELWKAELDVLSVKETKIGE